MPPAPTPSMSTHRPKTAPPPMPPPALTTPGISASAHTQAVPSALGVAKCSSAQLGLQLASS